MVGENRYPTVDEIGTGDWGLGTGGQGRNAPCPMPNPQSQRLSLGEY